MCMRFCYPASHAEFSHVVLFIGLPVTRHALCISCRQGIPWVTQVRRQVTRSISMTLELDNCPKSKKLSSSECITRFSAANCSSASQLDAGKHAMHSGRNGFLIPSIAFQLQSACQS